MLAMGSQEPAGVGPGTLVGKGYFHNFEPRSYDAAENACITHFGAAPSIP